MRLRRTKTQERIITELEHEIDKLKRENAYLKQLVPTGDNSKSFNDIMCKYKDAISDVNAIKAKYTTAANEMEALKRAYKNIARPINT